MMYVEEIRDRVWERPIRLFWLTLRDEFLNNNGIQYHACVWVRIRD